MRLKSKVGFRTENDERLCRVKTTRATKHGKKLVPKKPMMNVKSKKHYQCLGKTRVEKIEMSSHQMAKTKTNEKGNSRKTKQQRQQQEKDKPDPVSDNLLVVQPQLSITSDEEPLSLIVTSNREPISPAVCKSTNSSEFFDSSLDSFPSRFVPETEVTDYFVEEIDDFGNYSSPQWTNRVHRQHMSPVSSDEDDDNRHNNNNNQWNNFNYNSHPLADIYCQQYHFTHVPTATEYVFFLVKPGFCL